MDQVSKQKKAPLCRFINNCRQFKQNKRCNFRHDRCRFLDKCNDKMNCKFYHPEIEGQVQQREQTKQKNEFSAKPRPKIACRFGQNCERRKLGACTYSHDQSSTSKFNKTQNSTFSKGQPNFSMLCNFGKNCKKYLSGLCKYRHQGAQIPTKKTQIMSREQNVQQNQENMQARQQDYFSCNEQFIQFEQKKLCKNYAAGDCKAANCQSNHQLTIDNCLKRVYTKNFGNFCTTLAMFKANQNRIIAFSKDNILAFYQLDQQLQVLKSACTSQLKCPQKILKLASATNPSSKQPSLLFTTPTNKLAILQPTTGTMQWLQYPNPQQFTGAAYLTQQNILFISNFVSGMLVLKNGQKHDQLTNKFVGEHFTAISCMKSFYIMGESFLVVGKAKGYLGFVNKGMEVSHIRIDNSSIVDIAVAKTNQKPFAFVVAQQNGRNCKIFAVDLLDFKQQEVFSCESSKISAICIVYQRMFIAVDNLGILVYSLPDLRKIKGRIFIRGKVGHLQGDNDGNLIIQEVGQTGNTIFIYKVKK